MTPEQVPTILAARTPGRLRVWPRAHRRTRIIGNSSRYVSTRRSSSTRRGGLSTNGSEVVERVRGYFDLASKAIPKLAALRERT